MKLKRKNNGSNKIFLILLVLSIFTIFFTSCEREVSTTYDNFYTGISSLSLEFITGAPPNTFYEGEEFGVHAILKNEGAFNINESYAAKIKFIYDPSVFFSFTQFPQNTLQQIEGKGRTYIEGETTEFILGQGIAGKLFGNFESKITDFYVYMCFPYQTKFAEQVCIDTDVRRDGLRQQVCHADVMTFSGGQGAPVAVTTITPRMIPFENYVEPQFNIEVKNLGGGLVYQPKYESASAGGKSFLYTCSDDAILNLIEINATLMGEELVCIPNNISLQGGVGTTSCRFPKNSITMTNANFFSTLIVTLKYNYEKSQSKRVQIIRREDLNFKNFIGDDSCQFWEVKDGDKCISLCEYCSRNPYDQRCDPSEDANDKTRIGENFKCIYTSDECNKANAYIPFGKKETNCIERESLCWPGTYCGVPMCTIGDNNYAPEISSVESNVRSKIMWQVFDLNDNFGGRNLYPDSERTCGIKIDESTNKAISYYYFIQKDEKCAEVDSSLYNYVSSISAINSLYLFEANIPMNGDNYYKYVCLKGVDKLGKETIKKYEIENTNINTRLREVGLLW